MQTLISHATEDALETYALDRAAEYEAELLEQHLLICEPCRVALTGLDQQIQVIRRALSYN